jgi:hypothetical protein
MKVFSINGASEILERDRRTIVRAMRHVTPDAEERGQPRWRMKTILDALERSGARTEHHVGGGGLRTDLDVVIAQFDAAYVGMRAEPSLNKRRAKALKLAPLIAQMDRMEREVSAAAGEPKLLTELRADKIHMLLLRGLEELCEWSRDEVWEHFAGPQ